MKALICILVLFLNFQVGAQERVPETLPLPGLISSYMVLEGTTAEGRHCQLYVDGIGFGKKLHTFTARVRTSLDLSVSYTLVYPGSYHPLTGTWTAFSKSLRPTLLQVVLNDVPSVASLARSKSFRVFKPYPKHSLVAAKPLLDCNYLRVLSN